MKNQQQLVSKQHHRKIDPCVVILIGDDDNTATAKSKRITSCTHPDDKDLEAGVLVAVQRGPVFWFSPATWRGGFILGLGLGTVVLAQIQYQWGYMVLWILFLPSALFVAVPWKTFFVIWQRLTIPLTSFMRKIQSAYEEEEQLEKEDDALAGHRLDRQEAAFGGKRAPYSKPLRGCRCRACGWVVIFLLGIFLLGFVLMLLFSLLLSLFLSTY